MYLCIARGCCKRVKGWYVSELGGKVAYICDGVEGGCGEACVEVKSVPREAWWQVLTQKEAREVLPMMSHCRHAVFKGVNTVEVFVFPPCDSVPKVFRRLRLV